MHLVRISTKMLEFVNDLEMEAFNQALTSTQCPELQQANLQVTIRISLKIQKYQLKAKVKQPCTTKYEHGK
jgi:hypothetical protein